MRSKPREEGVVVAANFKYDLVLKQ